MEYNYLLKKIFLLRFSIQNRSHFFFIGITFLFFAIANSNAQSCTVNAGINQTICENETLQLQGNSSGDFTSTPVWSQISGPSVIISDTNIVDPIITGYVGGNTYVFQYAAVCQNGTTPQETVAITVNPITTASTGADLESCPSSNGSVIAMGNTPGAGETGSWSIEGSNDAEVTINFPNSPTTTLNLAETSAGVTTLRWTITNGSTVCNSFSDIQITNYGGETPVTAGPDQTLSNCYTATQSTSLSASFGGNNINGQQGTWIFVSGPSTPTISNVNNSNTGVSGLVEGTYAFRWSVSGPCVNGSDTVSIIVPAATQDVTTASIPDDNQRFCDTSTTQTTLVGSTPDFTNETVLWELIAGNGSTITIVDPTNPTTQVTGLVAPRNYQFRYTITNNITGCTSSDTARVRFGTSPTITANSPSGADIVGTCDQTRFVIPYTVTGGNRTEYSIISGPSESGLSFPTPYQFVRNSPARINVFDAPGNYTVNFRRRATGDLLTGCDEGTDSIIITVSLQPPGASGGSNQVLNCGDTSTSLAGSAVTIGSSIWSQVSGPNTAIISDIYAQNPVVSGLVQGLYKFRYSVSGGIGCSAVFPNLDTEVLVSANINGPSNAGTNQTQCSGVPVQLAANTPTADQEGTWSQTGGPPGVVFSDVNDPSATATGFSTVATYTLQWSVENSTINCGAAVTSTVDIDITGAASPTPADAGTDQCEPSGTTVITLAGNDPPAGQQGTWTAVPAAGVTFPPGGENVFNTTVTLPSDGTYTFTWTIDFTTSNGCAATSDDVEITIANTGAAVNAGVDQSVCLDPTTAPVPLSFTMAADIPASPGMGTWILVSGNAGFTVDNVNSPTATFSDLLDGAYVFQWRVDYGNCSFMTDEVTINVGVPPTPANIPGGDQIICGGNSTILTADPLLNPNTESGVWTLLSGAPNTPNIITPGSNNTNVTGLETGSYTFRWTTIGSSPLCPSSTADVIVDVYAAASAGPDQNLCLATSVFLEATAGTTGTWSIISTTNPAGTPGFTPIQSPANSNTANAPVDPGFEYVFEYTTDYTGTGISCNNSDQVTFVISNGPSEDPDAGVDQNICIADTTTAILTAGNASIPGDVTSEWRFVTQPSGGVSTIDTPNNSITTNVSNLTVPGLYILELNFESNFCTDKADIVRIQVFEAPGPIIEAGPDQPIACQLDAQLEATPPTIGIGVWSFANPADDPSTGLVVIDSPNNAQTTLSNIPDDVGNDGIADVYVLTWTVSNGPFVSGLCAPQSDTVTLTFTGAPPSIALAGSDQEFCNNTQTNLNATPVTSGIGTWTQTSGPNIANIASPNNPNTLVFGLVQGTYEFTWTTNGGGCSYTDSMEVAILSQPISAEAGPNQTIVEFSTLTLAADDPAPFFGTWTQLSGPNTATILNPNSFNSQVTGTILGTYVFEWTVSNGTPCPSVSDTVQIEVIGISDLELTKGVAPTSAKVGETVTFTISIFNNNATGGSSDATGVSVVDIIPAGYTLVPGTVSNSGVYNPGNLSITWSGLDITNGNTINLTFDTTVNETGSYDNSAEITASNQFDPDSTPNNNVSTEDDQSTVTVTIIPNDPPVAVDDASAGNTSGATVGIAILTNDTDADGTIDATSVNLTTPAGATDVVTDLDGDVIGFTIAGEGIWLYNDATGTLSFDPQAGFTGDPTDVTYTVDDNDGNTSNVATVSVGYTPTAPIANDDANTIPTVINTNTDINILTNDLLADGTTPLATDVTVDLDLVTAGVQTSFAVAGEGVWSYVTGTGIVTFTPDAGFTLSPTPITYELTDLDNSQSDTALITVTYQVVPVAVDDASIANTAGATVGIAILTNDTDADGSIDATSVNLTTPAGATDVVTDLDGDVIGFTIAGEGVWLYDDATGTLSFDPQAGFTGNPTDVTYTVDDNDGNTSNVATVSVGYTPTAPIATDDANTIPTVINTNTDINILTNDLLTDGTTPLATDVTVDLDLVTAGVQTSFPVVGEGVWSYATGTGIVTFTPDAGFTLSPTPITYELTDLDNSQSDTALITVTYQVVPVAVDDASAANTAGATVGIAILTNDTDADGSIDATSVNLTTPAGATDVVTDLDGDVIGFTIAGEGIWLYNDATGTLSFDPQAGFTGNPTDVTYTVDDNDGNTSNVATVSVGYTPTAPIANDDANTIPTVINTNTDINILTNDLLADGTTPLATDVTVDLDLVTAGVQTSFSVTGEGVWSYVTGTGIVTFTPDAGFTLSPTPITYELTDLDNSQSDTALITVTYQVVPVAVDDASIANTAGATVGIAILTNDTDADGSIDATSVNLTTPAGATDVVTDLDGDVIGFTIAGEGIWLYNDATGTLSFDPQAGFTGNPTDVTYTVDDNDGNTSNVATVSVGYTPTAPIATDDANTIPTVINTNTDINILTNDLLADGTTPLATDVTVDLDLVTAGVQTSFPVVGEGVWSYATGTGIVTFTPDAGFTLSPTPITYELTDLDNSQSDTALITVTYQVVPVAVDDASAANTAGATVGIAILTNDTDADGSIDATSVNLTTPAGATDVVTDLDGDVIGFTIAGEGVWLYDDATGTLSFDPQAGFTGNPTDVTYTVDDNDGNTSNVATVSVGYTPTAPIATDDANTIPTVINTNTDINILTNDLLADGTTPLATDVTVDLDLVTAGVQTSFSVTGEGVWSYATGTGIVTFTPDAGFTLSPTPITYELTDIDNSQSDTALITVTYQVVPVAVDDASIANTAGATVGIAILTNDTDADGTIDATSVNLTTPAGATDVVTDLDGDVIGFTIAGEGIWLYNDATGTLSFDPQAGFTGNPTDVTYTVDDNDGNTSNVATVSVGYTPTAPIANDDANTIPTVINTNTDINILTNDLLADGTTPLATDVTVDLDLVTAGVQTSFPVVGEGVWSYATGTGIVTFTPDAGFTLSPTPITYELTDLDNSQSDTALITVTYQVVPVAVDDASAGNTSGATVGIAILTNDTDADGSIDATSVNLTTPAGATDVVTDLDGDVIGFTIAGEGIWLYNDATGTLSFDPQAGFTGDPTDVTYTVDDNDGNTSNVATVSVGYTPTAPIANDDANTIPTVINTNTDINILTNDLLADGTTPLATDVTVDLDLVTAGVQTSFAVAGEGVWSYVTGTGIVTFTPDAGFTLSPTPITYELTDLDNSQSDTALITVTYQVVPVAVDDASIANTAGATVGIAILTNDTDADGSIDATSVNLTTPAGATDVVTDLDGDVIGFTIAGEGVWLYDDATGTLSFDPQAGFTGNPTDVTYTVDDNDGNTSNVATVSVGYTPTAPIATDDANTIPTVINTNTDINILTNDLLTDGTTPLATDVTVDLDLVTAGVQTSFSVTGEGVWSYAPATGIVTFTPDAGFTLSPTPITYELTDIDNSQNRYCPYHGYLPGCSCCG